MKLESVFTLEKNRRLLCLILAILVCMLMFARVYSLRQVKYLEDFKIYYYTAQAFKAGLNPYQPESINKMAGFDMKTIYRYAPYTLFIIRPLASLDYETSLALFMSMKALFLIGLLIVWHKLFEKMKFGNVYY